MATRRRFIAGAGSFAMSPSLAMSGVTATTSAETVPSPALLLEARTASLRLRPEGPETPILQFAGNEPLSVLRVKQGLDVAVRLINGLAEPISLLWHGIRGMWPNPSATAAAVAPGVAVDLRCRFPDSGTYWFHPAPNSYDQTARGLSGVLIVDEAQPPTIDQDLVVFLSDTLLDRKGDTAQPLVSDPPVILVNKRPLPAAWTLRPGSRLRLRLINGSTRRVMLVACEGARPYILAIDGQPSELFEPVRGTVPIGPGARFDYALDLPREAGKVLRLVLKGTERVGGMLEADKILATIATDGPPVDASAPIAPLPPNPVLRPQIALEASKRAELVLAGVQKPGAAASAWTIASGGSGARFSPTILKVRQGDAVTLGFENQSNVMVPLRVSGQALRLLHAKDDGWEPYWRDSVLLPPQSRNHVAFVADTPGRFAIESGFDAQLLAGLRCWLEVLRA